MCYAVLRLRMLVCVLLFDVMFFLLFLLFCCLFTFVCVYVCIAASAADVAFCERALELLIDLVTQLPTRRFFLSVVGTYITVVLPSWLGCLTPFRLSVCVCMYVCLCRGQACRTAYASLGVVCAAPGQAYAPAD